MKYKTLQVREKIDPIRSYFPRDVEEPEIYGYSADDKPIMIISMKSTILSINQLREIGEKRLKKYFERVEGVSEVIIGGGARREIEVKINEGRLLSHKIGFNQIAESISRNNINIPSGLIGNDTKYSVLIDGKFNSVDEIKSLAMLSTKNGSIISLDDLATVSDYAGKRENISKINETENVSFYIQKTGTANILSVAENIKSLIKNINNDNYQLEITYDQSEYIKNSIKNLSISSIIGAVIAGLVLFLFLKSFRNTFPILTAIPFSIISVFIYMYFKDITINIFSLSGLAIAAGMVVDSGIVILENINIKAAAPFSSQEEMIAEASAEMGKSIAASTLTSICIFIPVAMFGSSTRNIYSDMAGAVIVALSSSLFIALTIIPSVTDKLFSMQIKKRRISFLTISLSWIPDSARNLFHEIRIRSTAIKNKLPQYEEIMKKFFQHNKKIYSLVFLLLALLLFASTFLRNEYMEPMGRNEIYASVELPAGTSLAETESRVNNVVSLLQKPHFVKSISSKVEKWHADLIIKIKKHTDKEDAIHSLKNLTINNRIYKTDIFFQEDRSHESSKEIDVNITGPEIKTIRNIARDFSMHLRKAGIRDDIIYRFKDGRPVYEISINQGKANLTGLTAGEIGDHVRRALYGPVASKFLDMGEVDIRCRLDKKQVDVIYSLPFFSVITDKGKTIPLGEIADFKEKNGLISIWRKDKSRMETVSIRLLKMDIEGFVVKARDIITKLKIPDDYHISFGESLQRIQDSRKEMILGVILAIMLVYMVIAGIFESFILPIIILSSIPFACIGSLLILIIFGKSLNVSVFMGMIILIGIVVNNAIVLIDTIDRKVKNVDYSIDYVIQATKSRIRPVMMTTLTTVLGLFPLIFTGNEGKIWQSFAVTVISGLSVSSILVLVMTPLLYHSFYKNQ